MLKSVKKIWLEFVALWNRTVVFCLLVLIWFLVLTPTAIVRRYLQRMFSSKQTKKTSFLKKSFPISPNHFKTPF